MATADLKKPLLESLRQSKTFNVDTVDLHGLTTSEAEARLKIYGTNELKEKERNRLLEFLKHFWGPMPIMIWVAIIIEAIQWDVPDMLVLFALQCINGIVGWYEESKAGDAIAALKDSLAPSCNVRRDGQWTTMGAKLLVPGDIVKLALGGNIPADCSILDGKPIQVDQSAMTGESLPVTMRKGDVAKMGSNVVSGEIEAVVVATGRNTFFGKTAEMINSVEDEGHFQKILWAITLFLMAISVVLVGFIMAVMLLDGDTFMETLSICVVILVASIPIATQVVCTSTMALGSRTMAKKQAIVSRLAAIEELAGMDMLCSDKTGTLTLNKMTLQERKPFESGTTEKDLLLFALLSSQWNETAKDAIDTMLFVAKPEVEKDLANFVSADYVPFDPSVKRTESTVHPKGNPQASFKVTKGAPNIIAGLAHNAAEIKPKVDETVNDYAVRGIRCLGIARTDANGKWIFLGVLTFIDPPRPDTKEVIAKAQALGVHVKMITGDHVAIAKETCRMLDLGTHVLSNKEIEESGTRLGELAEGCDGFAGVFPEHKFDIVNALRGMGWTTGMTGDGVNDAPALKRADIGIAVQGATDAARAAADIVLLSPGLSVIVDAIDVSRQIFQRIKNYVTYRIACTLQLLVFFFLATLFIKPRSIMEDDSVPQYFSLPVMALVLITILNDGTLISIAYDYVVPGPVPEKWNLTIINASACVLGSVACASSILILFLCLYSDHPDSYISTHIGLSPLNYAQVRCAIYLKVSLSDFLTLFAARTHGWFFSRQCSMALFLPACFAMSTSTLFGRYWPYPEMQGLPWEWVGFIWAYCVAWFLLQDAAKVLLHNGLARHDMAQDSKKLQKVKIGAIRRSVKAALANEPGVKLQIEPQQELTLGQIVARIATLEAELNGLKAQVQKKAAAAANGKP